MYLRVHVRIVVMNSVHRLSHAIIMLLYYCAMIVISYPDCLVLFRVYKSELTTKLLYQISLVR
mgnify:CR=1 FL=1